MLHGYCIRHVADPAPDPALRGVAGADVILLREGAVSLWFSPVAQPPAPTLEGLREHDAVVRAALRTATPVPLRFGAAFDTADHAAELLREREGEMIEKLERIAGRVEMGIRVGWPTGAAGEALQETAAAAAEPPVASGRDYLESRRRRLAVEAGVRAAAEGALAQVEQAFSDLRYPTHRQLLPQPEIAGLLAHLVHREHLEVYRTRFLELRQSLPQLDLVLSGPWAPYSFV